MADVFSKRKRSEVMSRNCGRGSESLEVKVVAAEAKVFDDVSDDAAGHIARMPCERDEAIRMERIRVMPVASSGANKLAANLTQTTVKLAAVPGGIFAHRSGGENKFVAEGGRDGTSGFEQGFQMRLGSLLESQVGLATVAPVRMAARQQGGFGNPNAIFILTELHFRKWNDHNGHKVTSSAPDVKEAMIPRHSGQRLNLSTPWRDEAKRRRLNSSAGGEISPKSGQLSTGQMADVFTKAKRGSKGGKRRLNAPAVAQKLWLGRQG